MTRINLIDPSYLLDQHLLAEYKELPRIIAARKKNLNAKNPTLPPKNYKLGTGHVAFFFNKREFLKDRYHQLIENLYMRHYQINPIENLEWDILDNVNWISSSYERSINIERLMERFKEKPMFYTFQKQHITIENYSKILLEIS